jgi:hypothetical protein
MIHVFQLHNLSWHNLQINYANIMSRSMLSIPHQHKGIPYNPVRWEHGDINALINISHNNNPPFNLTY